MCPGNDKYKKSLNLKHTTLLQMTTLTLNRILNCTLKHKNLSL